MSFTRLGDGSFFAGGMAAFAMKAFEQGNYPLAITEGLISVSVFIWAQWHVK